MTASFYDTIIGHINRNIEEKASTLSVQKGSRPKKMPKNYDFSVRNVDFNQYRNDYILRTDAVWEHSKLMDMFYMMYKD